MWFSVVFLGFLGYAAAKDVPKTREFPKHFMFGVSTASYQIEGGWNASGKGENIWDHYTHGHIDEISDRTNGDVADDSYHLYKQDVQLLKALGVNYYRFSISWARILPTGLSNRINPDGIRYYNALIDELLKFNITPLVTMYHWDLPEMLEDFGGWPNSILIDYFEDYAKVLFDHFGDRVKMWITFNEPHQTCLAGYGRGVGAPGVDLPGIGEYLCAHNVLKAHARVYKMYHSLYVNQKGFVGITIDSAWFEPASDTPEDIQAANKAIQFHFGWFAHPIFSKNGDYPKIMRKAIDANSKRQNFTSSRLPTFTQGEIKMIRRSADFFGLNSYTTTLISAKPTTVSPNPSFDDDLNVRSFQDAKWPKSNSSWLRVVPWGFGKLINWVRKEYNNPTVLITENGVSTKAGLNDEERIYYINAYLNELLTAIQNGCKVISYTYWSLMDNFEWNSGYSERFGLYEVNYTSPQRTRTARKSAEYYKDIISSHLLPAAMEMPYEYTHQENTVDSTFRNSIIR